MFVVCGDAVHLFIGQIDYVVDYIAAETEGLHFLITLRFNKCDFLLRSLKHSKIATAPQSKNRITLYIQLVQIMAREELELITLDLISLPINQIIREVLKLNLL